MTDLFIKPLYLHAGRFDISAVTAQEIPRLERAPLIIPHGKQRCMFVVWEALFSAVSEGSLEDASVLSAEGSIDMRVSQRNRLSCKTKVPCQITKHDSEPSLR